MNHLVSDLDIEDIKFINSYYPQDAAVDSATFSEAVDFSTTTSNRSLCSSVPLRLCLARPTWCTTRSTCSSTTNPLESPSIYTLSERSEESIYTGPLKCQTSNFKIMDKHIRRQLIADLLDSHLSMDLITCTSAWDELTCDEQMTLADLIDS